MNTTRVPHRLATGRPCDMAPENPRGGAAERARGHAPGRAAAVLLSACAWALSACTGDLPDAFPGDAGDAGELDAGTDARTDARTDAAAPDAALPDLDPRFDAAPCISTGQELCGNALDDDCDGQFDEVPEGVGQPCREGLGTCARMGIVSCDDASGLYRCDAQAGPAAPAELCNGLDDDCDGAEDEGLGLGEACMVDFANGCQEAGRLICDLPGDGTRTRCDAPQADPDGDGHACDDDCKPNDALVNPGATEICDLVDQDCDGAADEGLDCPCEPRVRGGRSYLFCAGTVTQAAAAEVCGPYGQVPVEIGHATEQGFITRQATTVDIALSWWLGLRAAERNGPFAWASGAPITFTFWFGGQPEPVVRLAGQDCVELSQGASWVPVDCLVRNAVICEPPCAPGTDLDADGFEGCAHDCDDTESAVRPGGVETCGDAIDNDCDGRVDEC